MNENIGRSSARGAAKTRYLVEVASRLLQEHGYGQTSLDVLVREAKVSKTTVYSRFSSKIDLFKAVIQAACAEANAQSPGPTADMNDLEGILRMVAHDVLVRFTQKKMQAILFGIAEAGRSEPGISRLFWDSGPGIGARIVAEAVNRRNPNAPAFELGNQFVLDLSGFVVGRALLGFADFSNLDMESVIDDHVKHFLATNSRLLG